MNNKNGKYCGEDFIWINIDFFKFNIFFKKCCNYFCSPKHYKLRA